MLAGAAYAVQLMLRTSWQELDLSIPEIWRQIHQFLHEMPSSVRLCEFNDDLVGFFNSVPREMIVSALQMLIQDYQRDIRMSMFTIVDASGSLPVGFVLLKRKKMFRKGRTIVSYLHAPLRKMLAGAAYAIQLMLRTSWQGLDLSIPEIWRQLHQFLHETPSSVRLCEFNDDLVGFFNSVPREMIVSALQMLIQDYQRDIGVSMFTIDLRKTTASAQRALPHKPRGGRSRAVTLLKYNTWFQLSIVVSYWCVCGKSSMLSASPWHLHWQSNLPCFVQSACYPERACLETVVASAADAARVEDASPFHVPVRG